MIYCTEISAKFSLVCLSMKYEVRNMTSYIKDLYKRVLTLYLSWPAATRRLSDLRLGEHFFLTSLDMNDQDWYTVLKQTKNINVDLRYFRIWLTQVSLVKSDFINTNHLYYFYLGLESFLV